MQIQKHHYQIAGIALIVTVLIVAVYRLFFRTKAWQKMAGQLRTPAQRQALAKGGSAAPAYQAEKFPLKQGMKGSKIAQLQRYLRIEDDGIWGTKTSAAYQASNLFAASGKKAELSQDNYYAFQIDRL